MNPFVSVIIPTLNEEKTIESCIKKIQEGCQHGNISYEIIISDSSTDNTLEIACSYGVKVIHPEKRGYGNAYLAAFPFAKGDIIVIGDGDDTYDFSVIPELIKPITEGRADMVIGSRLKGKIFPGSMPWLHHYIGNPLLTWILNKTFHTNFSDAHSGLRAIKKSALDSLSLHTGGMEFASEMLIESARKGLSYEEIPIAYYPRVAPSNLHSFADGWRHVRFILLMRPIPFLFVPGGLFIIMGLVTFFILPLRGKIESTGLHSLILGAIFLTGGVQFMMTSLVLKAYAVMHGFDRCNDPFRRLLKYESLEIILFLGLFMIGAGSLLGMFIILNWIETSFRSLAQVTNAVLALCCILIGLQLFFSAIITSMMRLPK